MSRVRLAQTRGVYQLISIAARCDIVALPGTTRPFAPTNPKVLTHTIVRSNQIAASGEIVYVSFPDWHSNDGTHERRSDNQDFIFE